MPLLSSLIWLPVVGGFFVLMLGGAAVRLAKYAAFMIALATLALSVQLYQVFDPVQFGLQLEEAVPWIPAWSVHYGLGVDGFSVPLILLTSFTTVLVVLAAWQLIRERANQYMAAFLIMTGLMNGVFAATDALLFYVFWEAMLIPMFLIIGIWGGPKRVYASLKFFLYTFFGSVFMLIALLYLGFKAGSFDIIALQKLPLAIEAQHWIFAAFLIAFAVKVPMWPVHTWLPDAHVEAPTGGSVVLAAILLKMGTYGFVRFSLPITPDASLAWTWIMVALSLVAVVYIGLVALVQQDMKKLIAYSSIAHMGFVTLGFFTVLALLQNGHRDAAELALQGGLVQMISHGFISGALFLCVGVLYDRMHSREIASYGGVAHTMPVFAAFFMLFAMANAGLPGTSGFVGEFMVILAAWQYSAWVAALAGLTLIFGAAYTLWMVKRVMFGPIANSEVAALKDVHWREIGILSVLTIMVLLFGLWPAPLVEVMQPAVKHLIACSVQSKLSVIQAGAGCL